MSSIKNYPASSLKMPDPELSAVSSTDMPAAKGTQMNIKNYPCIAPPPGLSLDDGEEKDADKADENNSPNDSSETDDTAASSGDAQDVSRSAEAHQKGECQPCAYFWTQADGCRNGKECEFCHLCDSTALKAWKKEKKRLRKAEVKEEIARARREQREVKKQLRDASRGRVPTHAREPTTFVAVGVPTHAQAPMAFDAVGAPAHTHVPKPLDAVFSFDVPKPLDAVFYDDMPMKITPDAPPDDDMPMRVSRMHPMATMQGMQATPAMSPHLSRNTDLSGQSMPHIPADLLESYTKATRDLQALDAVRNALDAVASGAAAGLPMEKSPDVGKVLASEATGQSSAIAKAVASEVEKLVEVSYDVIAADKLLKRLQADLAPSQPTNRSRAPPQVFSNPALAQFMAAPPGYYHANGGSARRVMYW